MLGLGAPVVSLIAANLIPIAGVIYLGWDAGAILVLYWLESVVIGVLNVPKILACRDAADAPLAGLLKSLYFTLFFSVHFGAFSFAHGVIITGLFGGQTVINGGVLQGPLAFAAASFALSHMFSMVYNFFLKKEYVGRSPQKQMFAPYRRVFIMHFVIIFAGGLIHRFDTPLFALVLLIALKSAIDLSAHLKEHKAKEALYTHGE